MNSPGGSPSRSRHGFYPLNLNLSGQRVLVVGAGALALQITNRLVEFGAFVDVVAPAVVPEIQQFSLTYEDKVRIHRRSFEQSDEKAIEARQYILVFACTNSESENSRVLACARAAGVLSHTVDSPEGSDFILPSVMKRGHLKISVSTDGLSPALAKALRVRIESSLGTEIDKYVLFIRSLQEKLVELEADPRLGVPAVRRKILRQLADSQELMLAVQRENFEEARRLVDSVIAQAGEVANA